MYTVVLAGGIASGKSTVARMLEERGANRIDLDVVSREVCEPGSEVLGQLRQRFGDDVVDPRSGELRRSVLAQRAFATEESTQALEAITHPAIFRALERHLAEQQASSMCVIEVPLLDRALGYTQLADEVLCVTCPFHIRRERAIARGMDAADFDKRDAKQPSQEYLDRHATTVFVNGENQSSLAAQVDAWWDRIREEKGHGGCS